MKKVFFGTYRKKKMFSIGLLIFLFLSTAFNAVVGVAAEIQKNITDDDSNGNMIQESVGNADTIMASVKSAIATDNSLDID